MTQRQRYRGGFITKTETAPTATSASGVWSAADALRNKEGNTWPTVPDAPTLGTVSLSGGNGASIPFTTNDLHGASFTSATVTSNCGSFTATGSSSPLTVTGLTACSSYTFTGKTTSNVGTSGSSSASNSITATVPTSQQLFNSAGTYSWTAPTGVTKVSVVAVGGGSNGGTGGSASSGGGGGGGGLAYVNDITVTPGSSYAVVVGNRGTGGSCSCMSGENSTFNGSTVVATGSSHTNRHSNGSGGTASTGTGGTGGSGGSGTLGGGQNRGAGGGGAAGYSGNGGNGGSYGGSGTAAAACSGGGGGGGGTNNNNGVGGTGGGVGVNGKGSTGAAGSGGGGAGGAGSGGSFGKGGGGGGYSNFGYGSAGAVRIIWPGCARSFPSTCAGDV